MKNPIEKTNRTKTIATNVLPIKIKPFLETGHQSGRDPLTRNSHFSHFFPENFTKRQQPVEASEVVEDNIRIQNFNREATEAYKFLKRNAGKC